MSAAPLVAVVVVPLALLAFVVSGVERASLEGSSGQSHLIRKVKKKKVSHHLQLMADGEMIKETGAPEKKMHALYASQTGNDNNNDGADTDMCDDDFPLGEENAMNCTAAGHVDILQEEMCVQAAAEAGVTAPQGSFVLTSEWFDLRPKGCFMFPCSEDSEHKCYFFNPIGDMPEPSKAGQKSVVGTPVCRRPKFLNGTKDSNGGCPNGYEVIMNENNCSEAGICLGFCEGSEFREAMTNASRRDLFPEGCFIHKEEGCVYFNPPSEALGRPKHPKGTPICNVSTVTKFPPGGPVPGF